MGDWCDSGYAVDTATRENSDAVKRSAWDHEGKLPESMRTFRTRGELCPLDRSLLMGDPGHINPNSVACPLQCLVKLSLVLDCANSKQL